MLLCLCLIFHSSQQTLCSLPVEALCNIVVSQVACGSQHSVALTKDRNTPTPVHCLNMKKSIHISCGKDHTAVLTKDIHEESNTDSVNNVTQHCLDNMIDKWISECDLKSWKKIKHKDKHFQTSPKYSGLNLKLAQLAFEKLVKKDTVFAEVEAAVLHLLPSLDKKPVSVEGLRILLLLNELLHVTQRHKRHQTNTKLAEAVAAAVLNMSADSLQVIGFVTGFDRVPVLETEKIKMTNSAQPRTSPTTSSTLKHIHVSQSWSCPYTQPKRS
ncbi:hypothetical protein ABVT39_008597 [Epinephelus coioides]